MYQVSYSPYILDFNFPAKTSRGAIQEKPTYFLKVSHSNAPEVVGVGECSILKGLSYDDRDDYEEQLQQYVQLLSQVNSLEEALQLKGLDEFPSIKFAIETAFKDLENGGSKILFQTDFTLKEAPIPINGLVWMGEKDFMFEQVKKKLEAGFHCIKMKVGAINFEDELNLIKYIRENFSPSEIEIRVDANGAFQAEKALEQLKQLSEYQLHSIEQPIMPKQWEEMAQLCDLSPLPIALDEELIGVKAEKREVLLHKIKPQYIILKPSLLGGFQDSNHWIQLAKKQNIGWWMTSALESNIGLNAIAQFTSTYNTGKPQGLGTGQLYHNNIPSPLVVEEGNIYFKKNLSWGDVD